jgi:DNA-directed RNA polymerase specialized sigma24 family protein
LQGGTKDLEPEDTMTTCQNTVPHAAAHSTDGLPGPGLTPFDEAGEIRCTMVGIDDERRRKILSDRAVHEAIRAVARVRGMPSYDVDVILDTVVLDAMGDPRLPLDDADDARRYLCACARNKSIDDGRKRGRRARREVQATENEVAPGNAPPDDIAFASRLVREGEKRFPRTFPWFLRNTLYGESHVKIAVEANVSPGHVRHEVYVIRRALQGFSAVAILFALAVFVRQWTRPGAQQVDHDRDMAGTASAPAVPSAAPSAPAKPTRVEMAMALRERAAQEFARGDWADCEDDLEAADALDPAGATPETRALHQKAEKKLGSRNAKP